MWIDCILKRLDEIVVCHDDTDWVTTFKPVSQELVNSAKEWIIRVAETDMLPPSVIACCDGTIQFEWHTVEECESESDVRDVDLEVNFEHDGMISVMYQLKDMPSEEYMQRTASFIPRKK